MNARVLVFGAIVFLAWSASAAERTGTLRTIEQNGAIKIGFREDAPPISFVNAVGEPSGYSIDLCKAVAAEVATTLDRKDLSIDFVAVTSSNRFSSVADGTIDILCESTTRTLRRAETVDFTQPTFLTGATLLSRSGVRIETLGQLQGRKVAVIRETTTIVALKQALDTAFVRAEIVPVNAAVEGVEALFADNSDIAAFAADQIVLIGLIRSVRNGGNLLYLSSELFSKELFALAVRRNDADFRLIADRALSQLYRSGRIETIYNKWFAGSPPSFLLRALYEINSTFE
jgi:ABC-type amino acid transport substrate-binding protein